MTDMIRKSDAIAACRYDDARDCRDGIAALPSVAVVDEAERDAALISADAAHTALQLEQRTRQIVEAERDFANALLGRAKTELDLIRSKDCGAVYDILVRIEIDAHLGAKP